jgi:RNA-directed DNA polymerase
VPSPGRLFGKHIAIAIPPELADEATLLAYLKLGPRELKKIWWYRHLMYSQFSIAKGSGKSRVITAPNRRLKILQSKLAPILDQLYRVRNPVHGFVPKRSVKPMLWLMESGVSSSISTYETSFRPSPKTG